MAVYVRIIRMGALVLLAAVCYGQGSGLTSTGARAIGFPWDWSHEHVIFSQASDPQVLRVIDRDPRFIHQQLRRGRIPLQASSSITSVSAFNTARKLHNTKNTSLLASRVSLSLATILSAVVIAFLPFVTTRSRKRRWSVLLFGALLVVLSTTAINCGGAGDGAPLASEPQTLRSDWGADIGTQSSITKPNASNAGPMYPAKYTFLSSQTPSCANDFVVFPTGAQGTNTGANPTPSIAAFNSLYSSQGGGLPPGDCGTSGPSVAWAYLNVLCSTSTTLSSDRILSSPVISLDGKKVAWVTSNGKVQVLTIGTTGNNGTTISGAQCVENAPGGTGTSPNNAVLNSVTLGNAQHNPTTGVSLSELFVDYNSDSAYIGDDDGFLHKITPFFTATGALQEQTTPAWQALHGFSVGNIVIDSNGFIEECTGAGTSFLLAPAWNTTWSGITHDGSVTWTNEGSGGGWPVYVTGVSTHLDSVKLTGPVFDHVSKNIFVGDANGSLYFALDPGASTAVGSCANGQILYPCAGTPRTTSGITSAPGAQTDCSSASPNSTCMVMSNNVGFTDPVIVDSANSLVITQFSNADGSNARVEQTNTSLGVFNSATLGSPAILSNHIGAFDNIYFSSPATGFYYFCSQDLTGHMTELWRASFTTSGSAIVLAGTNGTPFQLTTTNNLANCSGLTEVFNAATSTDWLFLSVDNQGVTTTCNGHSCVMSFSLGNSMVTTANASYAGSSDLQGTGGFIVDNVANTSTFPQSSSIYFMPAANNLACGDGSSNTSCAVKLTQSGLH